MFQRFYISNVTIRNSFSEETIKITLSVGHSFEYTIYWILSRIQLIWHTNSLRNITFGVDLSF